MRIGQFVTLLNTTKDTVPHYEELNLLTPTWKNNYKEYGEKEVLNFEVVKELKDYGLTLKEIQMLFNLKQAFGCGDKQLITQFIENLTDHLEKLRQEEQEIHNRRIMLENEIGNLKELIKTLDFSK